MICGITAPPCSLVAYMIGYAVHWDGQGAVLTLPFVVWFWFGSIMAILHSAVLLLFSRSRLTGLTKNCLVAVLIVNLFIYALTIVLYLNRPMGQRRRSETAKHVTIFGSDALGNRTTLGYDNVGRVATVMNARGYVSTNTYNARSDLVSVTDALAGVSEFFYDALGRRIASKTPLGFLATTVYDAAGQVSATIDPLSNITTMQYDLAGNRTTLTDARSKNWISVYSASSNHCTWACKIARRCPACVGAADLKELRDIWKDFSDSLIDLHNKGRKV